MEKKNIPGRRLRLTYNLTPADEKAMKSYLLGDMTSRELSKIFGMSHQGAINVVTSQIKEWAQTGKITFNF